MVSIVEQGFNFFDSAQETNNVFNKENFLLDIRVHFDTHLAVFLQMFNILKISFANLLNVEKYFFQINSY
jgi:hypothetical protein